MQLAQRSSTRLSPVAAFFEGLAAQVAQDIVGHDAAVRWCCLALAVRGHLLVSDVPGVAKTRLAKSLARALGLSFGRVQCTPDLLPVQMTGFHRYHQGRDTYEFLPGPLLNGLVLADELNRATPAAKAGILEAMQEHQVTVDGRTYPVPAPGILVAAMNPLDEGIYPLTLAERDRFALHCDMGYLAHSEALAFLANYARFDGDVIAPASAQLGTDGGTGVANLQQVYVYVRDRVSVGEEVLRYVADLCAGTRTHPQVTLGASDRAMGVLLLVAKAWAAMAGQDVVTPDDVKQVAPSVLAHRLHLKDPYDPQFLLARQVMLDIMQQVPVPGSLVVRAAAGVR